MREAYKELRRVNDLEEEYKLKTDAELRAKTDEFKKRLAKGETIFDIRAEAFATVREAAARILKQRLFDVQVLGGIILTKGAVAEMKTGEGKTLTSIAPVYLYALKGNGAIVVTVNEYLAQRDAEEMSKVHNFLGLSVGVNLTKMNEQLKRQAYSCDITYSVHAELGFDYLRDNMVSRLEEKVQRPFTFALIDEVDLVLIDEAKTPLIISGGSTVPIQAYASADIFVKTLTVEDYEIDWESKTISMTDEGVVKGNKFFGVKNIFDVESSELVHRISNALRANYLMKRDVDYIVRRDAIDIVDAFTGRIMEGRSFSDGLHQAIQAKEHVKITPETATLATITYQNLFRMFSVLSGMSGTAKTEEDEFIEIYNMRVHQIPTNKPVIRIDHPDEVYLNIHAKSQAIVQLVKQLYEKGQPVLLGTEEVVESERLSDMLSRIHIPHTVLNAKQNETEADIISRAGYFKAVTIATNMAGRGTDIKPSKESLEVGGLYVIGTNKAEARRIDNQLKGRSGRQGDPGESKFIISLDDKLVLRFANQERLQKAFSSFKNDPIPTKQIGKAINSAQVRIEGFNFDARKNVLQYDDVIRQQRDLIYAQRDMIIGHADLINVIRRMLRSVVKDLVTKNQFTMFRRSDHSIDPEKMVSTLNGLWFSITEFKIKVSDILHKSNEELINSLYKDASEVYDQMRQNIIENIGPEGLEQMERSIILTTFDRNWQLHIDKMAKLKSSTNLSSYAQKNPFQVYVEKGAEFFNDLLMRISHNAIRLLFNNSTAIKRVSPQEVVLAAMVEKAIEKQEQSAPAEQKSASHTHPSHAADQSKTEAVHESKPHADSKHSSAHHGEDHLKKAQHHAERSATHNHKESNGHDDLNTKEK